MINRVKNVCSINKSSSINLIGSQRVHPQRQHNTTATSGYSYPRPHYKSQANGTTRSWSPMAWLCSTWHISHSYHFIDYPLSSWSRSILSHFWQVMCVWVIRPMSLSYYFAVLMALLNDDRTGIIY
jgi:hypothetical protein